MKNRISLGIGLGIIFIFFLMVLFPNWFTNYGIKDMFGKWEEPSSSHILGCNDMGYDIWTELVYGTRDTLFIGLLSAIFSLLLGGIIGILSTEEGPIGAFFNGIISIFVLLPKLVLILVLGAFLGGGRIFTIFLISIFSFVGTARNVRGKVLSIKEQPFMDSLRVLGYNGFHRNIFHILPNLKDILITRFLTGITSAILMESTLSFLGLGDTYHPTWGTMIHFAYKRGAFFREAYHYLLAPGICIMMISFSFYLISNYFERKNLEIGGIQYV